MEDFEWNVANEIHLLEAMVGHKPVGINKHFQMVVIWEKFTANINKYVPPEKVWAHLETLYNLEALDDMEFIPFPNNEIDFNLPDAEFGVLKSQKEEKLEDKKSLQKSRETPKIVKENKKEDKSGGTKTSKDIQRRDSKDSGKDIKMTNLTNKKEIRKDAEKNKAAKGRPSSVGLPSSREEGKNNSANVGSNSGNSSGSGNSGNTSNGSSNNGINISSSKNKNEDTPRSGKRPTRGSTKSEDGGSNGKASPVNMTPASNKRRRT